MNFRIFSRRPVGCVYPAQSSGDPIRTKAASDSTSTVTPRRSFSAWISSLISRPASNLIRIQYVPFRTNPEVEVRLLHPKKLSPEAIQKIAECRLEIQSLDEQRRHDEVTLAEGQKEVAMLQVEIDRLIKATSPLVAEKQQTTASEVGKSETPTTPLSVSNSSADSAGSTDLPSTSSTSDRSDGKLSPESNSNEIAGKSTPSSPEYVIFTEYFRVDKNGKTVKAPPPLTDEARNMPIQPTRHRDDADDIAVRRPWRAHAEQLQSAKPKADRPVIKKQVDTASDEAGEKILTSQDGRAPDTKSSTTKSTSRLLPQGAGGSLQSPREHCWRDATKLLELKHDRREYLHTIKAFREKYLGSYRIFGVHSQNSKTDESLKAVLDQDGLGAELNTTISRLLVKNQRVRNGLKWKVCSSSDSRAKFEEYSLKLRKLLLNLNQKLVQTISHEVTSRIEKLAPVEAGPTAISIDTMLAEPALRESLRIALKAEFSTENLDFYEAVESFKNFCSDNKNSADSILGKAKEIYSLYINKDATQQVNISGEMRKALDEFMTNKGDEKPPKRDELATLFDSAQKEIKALIATDSLARLAKMQSEAIKKQYAERG